MKQYKSAHFAVSAWRHLQNDYHWSQPMAGLSHLLDVTRLALLFFLLHGHGVAAQYRAYLASDFANSATAQKQVSPDFGHMAHQYSLHAPRLLTR